jgi:hypothetical protein
MYITGKNSVVRSLCDLWFQASTVVSEDIPRIRRHFFFSGTKVPGGRARKSCWRRMWWGEPGQCRRELLAEGAGNGGGWPV